MVGLHDYGQSDHFDHFLVSIGIHSVGLSESLHIRKIDDDDPLRGMSVADIWILYVCLWT